ncbi:MAG: hypothetical protein M1819_002300 [Sarea resinae]|nr:MAG: hypothetical protein M1819_002300 [Sarea resinae]
MATVSAPWPPKPDLFDEVQWSSYPTLEQYKQAFQLWKLPNAEIDIPELPEAGGGGLDMDPRHSLVRRLYSRLKRNSVEPEAPLADAQRKHATNRYSSWSAGDVNRIINPSGVGPTKETILVDNRTYKPYWKQADLKAALRSRGLDTTGVVSVLKDRLFDYELQELIVPYSLPRSNLGHWGIDRAKDFIIPSGTNSAFDPFDLYTLALQRSPYNPTYWVSRGFLFYQIGFYDLALGDAYRAWYLVEHLVNSAFRNKQPGLYPRIWDSIVEHLKLAAEEEPDIRECMRKQNGMDSWINPAPQQRLIDLSGIDTFIPSLRRALHHIISLSLIALEAWEDYSQMDEYATQRLRGIHEDVHPFTLRMENMRDFVKSKQNEEASNFTMWAHERSMGNSHHTQMYPQSARNVDRAAENFRQVLTNSYINGWPGADPEQPLLEVRQGEVGLAVHAQQDIDKGAVLYTDEPSARGNMRRQHRMPNLSCENCKKIISRRAQEVLEEDWEDLPDLSKQANQEPDICACLKPEQKMYFCRDPSGANDERSSRRKRRRSPSEGRHTRSRKRRAMTGDSSSNDSSPEEGEGDALRRTCLEPARNVFHYRACGKDWEWLHHGMQNLLSSGEGVRYKKEVNHERHGTILSLLLRDVFDMTLMARDKGEPSGVLAHEIDAMIPLCGGEDMLGQRFPFRWAGNIVVPFDIVLALGVDIFADLDFDTWVIQLVLRKLLLNVVPWDKYRRGIEARINYPRVPVDPEYEPEEETCGAKLETFYLHTGYALFNHACGKEANAKWFWDKAQYGGINNRIIVQATRPIAKDEEIRVKYYYEGPHPGNEPENEFPHEPDMLRSFGRGCDCARCTREREAAANQNQEHHSDDGDDNGNRDEHGDSLYDD